MSVGKGFTRPEKWPPVGSIIRIQDHPQIEDGWAVVHLTRASLLFDNGQRYDRVGIPSLYRDTQPLYKIFRSGRGDYSRAWHQALPWMENAR